MTIALAIVAVPSDFLNAQSATFADRAAALETLRKTAADATDRDRQSLATVEWLRQLEKLAADVPFGPPASGPPYRPWLEAQRPLVVYNEPGGMWMVPATVVWPIHDRLRDTVGAEDIAWIAATAGLPGECEGFVFCYMERADRRMGEYLRRHPEGRNAAAAVAQVDRSVTLALESLQDRFASDHLDPARDCRELAPALNNLARAIEGSSARTADALVLIDALARHCPR